MTLEFWGEGRHKITIEELQSMKNVMLLDVRSNQEAESIAVKFEHHPNILCKTIPIDEIPDRIDEISKDWFIAVFCPANVRSTVAYMYLLSKGFKDVRILDGGYSALSEAVKPPKIWKIINTKEKR
jgi:rhodanese-related sulfurtransferase